MSAPDPGLNNLSAAQRAKTEALAKYLFRYGNPDLTGTEHDLRLGTWEEADEMVQRVWLNLAAAAYLYTEGEVDGMAKPHSNEQVEELEAQVAHWKWECGYWRGRAEKPESEETRVSARDYTRAASERRAVLEGEQ